MKAFRVAGSFPMGRIKQTFTVEVAADDEAGAKEKVLSNIGSKHYVMRRFIKISSVDAVKTDDVENHVVKHLVGGSK